MNEWDSVRLGDLAEVKGGKRLPKGHALQSENNGSPYIRIVDCRDGDISDSNLLYVPQLTQPHIDRYRVSPGDVFVSIVGTVGLVAQIPKSLDGAFLTENAAKVSVTTERLDASYLRYVLASERGQQLIQAQTVGSTQPKLALHRIRDIRIPLPPIEIQRATAEVLGALDEKIAANRRLVASSWALAGAKFTGLMKSAQNQTVVGQVLTLEYGKPLPAADRVPGRVDVFGSGGIVGAHTEPLAPGPGVIVGRKGTAGAVHWAPNDYYPIDTTFYVVPKRLDQHSMIFCYFLLDSLSLSEQNSDSAVPGLNRNEAHAMKVRLPDAEACRRLTITVMPLIHLAGQADRESEALIETRDALLPLLMSGKLRVRDAEKVLEGVL